MTFDKPFNRFDVDPEGMNQLGSELLHYVLDTDRFDLGKFTFDVVKLNAVFNLLLDYFLFNPDSALEDASLREFNFIIQRDEELFRILYSQHFFDSQGSLTDNLLGNKIYRQARRYYMLREQLLK